MYRLATKCTKKRNEKRHKCLCTCTSCARESKRHGSFVNNDTRHRHGRPRRLRPARLRVPCADCGLRTQIRSNCWICGLTANEFLFRGRDVAVTMNSVKILHAVRSAITAIAELFVLFIISDIKALCLRSLKPR